MLRGDPEVSEATKHSRPALIGGYVETVGLLATSQTSLVSCYQLKLFESHTLKNLIDLQRTNTDLYFSESTIYLCSTYYVILFSEYCMNVIIKY